jgi:hypothetical protein
MTVIVGSAEPALYIATSPVLPCSSLEFPQKPGAAPLPLAVPDVQPSAQFQPIRLSTRRELLAGFASLQP